MKAIDKMAALISKQVGATVGCTHACTNLVTIWWDGENKALFEKLQVLFKGVLFGYEYDAECDMSVCCWNI